MASEPDVLMQIAVESAPGGGAALTAALARLAALDPLLVIESGPETGTALIGAESESRLRAAADMLRAECATGLALGEPQVAYRETLISSAECDYCHKAQSGGSGEFAAVRIAVEPIDPSEGMRIVNRIPEELLPSLYSRAAAKGAAEQAAAGSLAGFPMVGIEIILLDGKYHDLDSSPAAFETAGRGAIREAARMAGTILLEPVMSLEIHFAVEDRAAIRRLLESLGAEIEAGESARLLKASAPLAGLFGFERALAALGGGTGKAAVRFLRYAPVAAGPGPDDGFPAAAALRA